MNPRIAAVLFIALTSVLGVAGQTLAKIGLERLAPAGLGGSFGLSMVLRMLSSPLVWAGGTLLVIGTLLFFQALSKFEFSLAMPLGSLLQVLLSVVVAKVQFKEPLSPARWLGIALAIVAVWLLASPGDAAAKTGP